MITQRVITGQIPASGLVGMGLQSIVANRHVPPWERQRPTFITFGQEPPSIIQAVANVFGELILLGVGLVASLAVFVFVSPLWGVVMAVALGSGYYLWRAYTEREYERLQSLSSTAGWR